MPPSKSAGGATPLIHAIDGEGDCEVKVVINKCFGGFSLSKEAYKELGLEWDRYGYLSSWSNQTQEQQRSDPRLVAVVEKLGVAASGECANLRVVEIPDDVQWEIEEYDGYEHVAEKHRTWS